MAYQAARTIPLKTLYKTVAVTPFGVMKRSKKHSVSGTARKRTLKGIAKTTIAKHKRKRFLQGNTLFTV